MVVRIFHNSLIKREVSSQNVLERTDHFHGSYTQYKGLNHNKSQVLYLFCCSLNCILLESYISQFADLSQMGRLNNEKYKWHRFDFNFNLVCLKKENRCKPPEYIQHVKKI